MSEARRLSERNAAIAEMLSNGEELKKFYRFTAQNPHIELHDACQIIISRTSASVCFAFEEWNAMGRRIIKDRKGIPYFDRDGNKLFVFDANDTHGDKRYQDNFLPMNCLLDGLDIINNTNLSRCERGNYRQIHTGVGEYLKENGVLAGDTVKNRLLIEGITYSLYCKTGFHNSSEIELSGLPFSLAENAELFKEINELSNSIVQEAEEAYRSKQHEVKVVDDIEVEIATDEPSLSESTKESKIIVETQSAVNSNYRGYIALVQFNRDSANWQLEKKIYLGKRENYDNNGHYDNTNNSLIYLSNNPHIYTFLYSEGWIISQQEMIDKGYLSEKDYAEFHELQNTVLGKFEQLKELKFEIDYQVSGSGVPFSYPNWKGKNCETVKIVNIADGFVPESIMPPVNEPHPKESKNAILPHYQRYLNAQQEYQQSVVLTRIGDFYEVMGETAVIIANELDLTLAGRNVGLPERVPMCGFPYHIMNVYVEKILEKHSVLVIEENKEPIYILSHEEVFSQKTDETAEQKTSEEEINDYEDSKDEFSEFDDEEDYDNEFYADLEASDEETDEKQPQEKQKGKPLSERTHKEKYQPTLFDLLDVKEIESKTTEERLIEWGLKNGSNVENSKLRIYDEYIKDPSMQEFAVFLKNEYGWGASYNGGQEIQSDGKGLGLAWRDKEHPENDIAVKLKWTEVSIRIADLIDDDNYLNEMEKHEYLRITRFRDERTLAKTDCERIEVIANQIIEYGTKNTYSEKFIEYPHFLENFIDFYANHRHEINEKLLQRKEVASASAAEFSFANGIEVCFKLEYCPRWQKRLKRIAEETERLRGFADGFIQSCADNYGDKNIVDNHIVWNILPDEMEMTDYLFLKDNRDELVEYLQSKNGVESAELSMQSIIITFQKDYIEILSKGAVISQTQETNFKTHTDSFAKDDEKEMSKQGKNTDLNEIGLNQSELGGAKQRYRNNLEAIRLTNLFLDKDRNPTAEEKKALAKYVGWGGLAQVFDEANPQWSKEFHELKAQLSIADYEQAKGSVLNAHYTSKEVIEGIYKALAQFGVKGNNRILEPAMGTGNFFGYMPKEIADGAKLYGVELDNLTGRIAAKLYPQVNVQVKGFEETTFSNNYFDVVVGNVPFGGYGVADSDYNRYKFLIHDYFIAKSLDKTKAEGIVAVITSKGTMDKLNPSVRKYIADRAELLGAIRLPNIAFKQTANTEVVTDILFFRKREEQINADMTNTQWLSTGKTEQGYEINSYFINHPEMVLGLLVEEYGLYGAKDITVKSDGRELVDALSEAIEQLPKDFYSNPNEAYSREEETGVDYDIKPLNFKAENGKLFMRIGDRMAEQEIPNSPKDAYERISGMIELRSGLRHILNIQTNGCSDEQLVNQQRILNANYDQFVKRYGFINSQTNTRLFRDDGDSALLFACEELSENKQTALKADVFSKRTIRPYVAVTSTDDCLEALQITKNERGKVDISYIEELTKKDYDTVLAELDNAVFRNPLEVDPQDKYSGFETAEEYLSGKVVQKLQTAKAFITQNPNCDYGKNISALIKVQPEQLSAANISVRLGASWVNKDYYVQFICNLLGIPNYYNDGLELYFNPHDSSWRVDKTQYVRSSAGMKATEVYGTNRANAFRLFEDCLNLRATNIYDTIEEDGREKRVLNQAETIAAREKQNKIKEAFREWIFNDPKRREELEATYNRLFNQMRLPQYDGSYLRFPEMNPAIELKSHQKNAVHRIITGGNTLLHHVVGSGKTFTICAAIMKLKQYGLAKKPMVAVPNHLVEQWSNEFRTLYPNAKLLIASKEDLSKENRQKFVSKVALGDWDAVIIAQSSYAKIPISPERQIVKIREEINKVDISIAAQYEDGSMPRGAVKNLERIKKNKETQLKRLFDDNKKDNLLTFESLGVDYQFVDEAHFYKNKFLFTKMNNVAGISTTASQRAADLEMKVEYINELHNGDKGVVFATGTPISNSMTEMYTMQSYLQKRTLEEVGLNYFDGWAADFGETITSLELAPSGQGYKPRTRFAKFTNLPELQTFYRMFADVQTAEMVKLNVPETERKIINLKPSETVIELAEQIAERAERIYNGGVDPREDNMLKVTSDGKKLALDARCFDPVVGDEESSKLNACAAHVYEIWEDTADKHSAQIVFCDMSTPKMAFTDYEYGKNFDVYNDLKYKLTEKGIPDREIAFIHDANSDLQKQDLFKKVNAGQIRVLIGSTEKCGAGTNAQQRLVALHHLDTPYRPSDMEQREGRIIRQGNTNDTVQIFTYVTERTFDSYSYQILENKQRFISQICHGDMTAREADDIDETTLSYAEIKAITAANPRIKRKMEVDSEVAKLRVLEGQYRKNLYALQDNVNKTLPEQIRKQTLFLERLHEDIIKIKSEYNPDIFSISVSGVTYTDKKEGGRVLTDALYTSRPDAIVAEYGGFKISMQPLVFLMTERSIKVEGNGQYSLEIGQSASGNITRLDNFFADFTNKEIRAAERLSQLKNDFATVKGQLDVPFEHKERLMELLKEQSELNAELDLNRREEVVIDDDSENADELNTLLPNRRAEHSSAKRKDRKPLNKYSMSEYDKQKAETPDAYIFVKNGSKYELFGEQAEKYAKSHGMPFIVDTLDDTETLVLSLESEELDKTIGVLVEGGKMVKIIETLEEKKEDKFIDIIDKVAKMEVPLLPDYTISQEDMHECGYKWDGMLPLCRNTALRLWGIGLQIFKLRSDDTETETKEYSQFEDGIVYGIEKPVWKNYLENKTTTEYLAARMFVSEAASKVANEDLSYVDAQFIDGFINNNYEEREALKQFMRQREMPDIEKMKPYISNLLNEFANRIAAAPLEEYGWARGDVPRAIAEHITQEDLKGFANDLTKFVFDVDKQFDKLLDGKNAGEIDELMLPNLSNKLTVIEKQSSVTIKESASYHRYVDGCLLLRDDTAKKWYSINNMFVKGENNEYLEVGDSATVKTILAYMGLHNGNPFQIFNSYNEAQEYFQDKVMVLQKMQIESEPTYYYGRDTENAGYYYFKEKLSNETLSAIKEKADYYVIAAPVCYISSEEQKEKNILFLKIGRDITNEELISLNNAVASMQKAAHKINSHPEKHIPVYLHTWEYAYTHGEQFYFNNSRLLSKDCINAIDNAIKENYKEEILGKGFEEKIVEKFGLERVSYVLATLIQNSHWDGRYSIENKEWFKGIPVSESTEERRYIYSNEHPGLIDLLAKRIRLIKKELIKKEEQKLTQDKYFGETANGYKVLNLEKNQEGRNIAIIARKKDFVVAVGYDISDGTWQHGYYDFESQKEAEEFMQERFNASEEKEKPTWQYVSVDKAAKIAKYDNRTLFKMPKGEHKGYVYYLPNKLLKEIAEKGTIRVGLPEDFVVRLQDKQNDTEVNLTLEEYIADVKGKTEDDYNQYYKPSDGAADKFSETEANLRKNVPDEMKARPNWVAVRTRQNEEKGRLEKFLIDCHTSKFAESDNAETWTDFESACKFARENGGVALAYALDGKDGICCIDLDHCIDDNGKMTPIAHAVKDYGGAYIERSLSGKGLHFFGKTKGFNVRTFSKEGDLEFYQKAHFIAMTGEILGGNKLINIDGTRIQELIEAKCERRNEWNGAGLGIGGLSTMSDRDIVDKASVAKHSETFKALYDGKDLQNNRSNSDMSLMNRLAFWCNGDKEQMLRIFATSGLFRQDKSQSYYECTAIKAVRDTTSRFQPQSRNESKREVASLKNGNSKV